MGVSGLEAAGLVPFLCWAKSELVRISWSKPGNVVLLEDKNPGVELFVEGSNWLGSTWDPGCSSWLGSRD
ncbi:hypothetical protein V6N13_133760 [Hibiscus sabdariffa]